VHRKAIQTVQLLLNAIERTHGYLSKTVLAQHFAGTASKSVTGLRLERLPEFGVLKPWKKAHSTQALEVMLEAGLLAQAEFKLGKQTLVLTELGKSSRADAGAIPKPVSDFFANAWHASDASETALELPKQSAKQREATWDSSQPAPSASPVQTSSTVPTTPPVPPASPAPSSSPAPSVPPVLAVPPVPTVSSLPSAPRSSEELPIPQPTDAQSTATGASALSDWQWTVRLVKHGYRLGEIALIRGKTPDGVLADLTIALQMEERFEIRSLFDARTFLTIEELAKSASLPEKPPTLLLVFSGLWDFVLEWLKVAKALK
jgi:hypothetical protein